MSESTGISPQSSISSLCKWIQNLGLKCILVQIQYVSGVESLNEFPLKSSDNLTFISIFIWCTARLERKIGFAWIVGVAINWSERSFKVLCGHLDFWFPNVDALFCWPLFNVPFEIHIHSIEIIAQDSIEQMRIRGESFCRNYKSPAIISNNGIFHSGNIGCVHSRLYSLISVRLIYDSWNILFGVSGPHWADGWTCVSFSVTPTPT